ncbi:MAG TPA: GIY-YIG nuclease family protein [Ktedonobacterales bacterium]|nr:GIY-YIG nuclease family protein [Ktedonobacterales bacterium]
MDSIPSTTFIYALIDPRDQTIRYIGKSNDPQFRLIRHIRSRRIGKTIKNSWIISLISQGLLPVLQTIEEVPVEHWEERERYWIQYYREQGSPLTNGTDGGDGVHGRKRTPEERQRISASLMGNKRPLGTHASEQTRAKHSEDSRRTWANSTPEQRAERGRKISAAKMGHEVSIATRQKFAAALRGRKIPLEVLATRPKRRQHRCKEVRGQNGQACQLRLFD